MFALFRQLHDAAAATPEAHAIEQDGRIVTYDELMRYVGVVRRRLVERLDGQRARVVVAVENSPEYVAALYGCWAAGCTAVPISATASARELEAVQGHSGARAIISTSHNRAARSVRTGGDTPVLLIGASDEHSLQRDATEAAWPARPDCELDDHAMILYTSGTTGRPKGVLLTHRNLAANVAATRGYLGITSSDRVLVVLPFHYSYGNSVLHTHLSCGATLILVPPMLYAQSVVDAMRATRPTGFSGVPTTFGLLLNKTDWSSDPAPLRYVTQAGGPMGAALTRRLMAALKPQTRLYIMYGQTEACARITWLPPERLHDKLGSVGIPIDGNELMIADEQGWALAPGEVGEVLTRGPSIMAGYWGDEDATRRAFRGDWLRTGDLGYLDEEGFLFLVGRNDDMIKTGAHRVSPAEIEEVIEELGIVDEVAVCGVPDEIMGQAICAVLVGERSLEVERAIMRHCRAQLAMHKRPRSIAWRDALPKTASGKLMRHTLVTGEHGWV